MFIIDIDAEQKYKTALQTQPDIRERKCLYIRRSALPALADLPLQILCSAIAGLLPAGEVYACRDGDLFILDDQFTYTLTNRIGDELRALTQVDVQPYFRVLDPKTEELQIHAVLEAKINIIARTGVHVSAQEEHLERLREVYREVPAELASTLSTRRLARQRGSAMLVEHDTFLRLQAEATLRGECDVLSLETKERILIEYATAAPDILFLGMEPDDAQSLHVLENILALDPEAYTVMLSPYAGRSLILKALETGAQGFIDKTFTRQKLLQYVAQSPHIRRK